MWKVNPEKTEDILFEIHFDGQTPYGRVSQTKTILEQGPVVIVFPGNGFNPMKIDGSSDSLEVKAQKMANKLRKLLEKTKVDSKIIQALPFYVVAYNTPFDFSDRDARTLLYKKHKRTNMPKDVRVGNKGFSKEEENPAYIENLYNQIIRPRITRLDGKIKLDAEAAAQNMGQIVIFAHCHGAYTALKLEEYMAQKMKELKYTEHEVEFIQKQINVTAYAPACPLGVSKMNFVSFKSLNDTTTGENYNDALAYLGNRVGEDRAYWADIICRKKSSSDHEPLDFKLSFYPDRLGNVFMIKQKGAYENILEFESQDDSLYLGENLLEQEHNSIMAGDTEDSVVMQEIMQRVLANAVLHAVKQQEKLHEPLTIQDLAVGQASENKEADLKVFDDACQAGQAYYKEFYGDIVRILRVQSSTAKKY